MFMCFIKKYMLIIQNKILTSDLDCTMTSAPIDASYHFRMIKAHDDN